MNPAEGYGPPATEAAEAMCCPGSIDLDALAAQLRDERETLSELTAHTLRMGEDTGEGSVYRKAWDDYHARVLDLRKAREAEFYRTALEAWQATFAGKVAGLLGRVRSAFSGD